MTNWKILAKLLSFSTLFPYKSVYFSFMFSISVHFVFMKTQSRRCSWSLGPREHRLHWDLIPMFASTFITLRRSFRSNSFLSLVISGLFRYSCIDSSLYWQEELLGGREGGLTLSGLGYFRLILDWGNHPPWFFALGTSQRHVNYVVVS